MNRIDLKFAALAAAMALAVTGATIVATMPVSAAELVVDGRAPTARISYADLDLASPAGVARLERRVAAAADRLCTGVGEEALAARLDGFQCRAATIAAAEPQVRRAVERMSMAQASSGRAITLTLGY
ncbi:MAG TPA: UrcA family protein [Allosphingosinicella sp.]|jgi:UrcA family protein